MSQLKDILQSILKKLFPQLHISHTTTNSVLWIFSSVIALIVLYFFIRFLLLWRSESRAKHKPIGTAEELALTVQHHLETADDAERQGDLREAVRSTFLAIIMSLNEQGWIKAMPFKTNGDYISELNHSLGRDHVHFEKLADLFDEVVYGGKNISFTDYHAFRKGANRWIQIPRKGEEGLIP